MMLNKNNPNKKSGFKKYLKDLFFGRQKSTRVASISELRERLLMSETGAGVLLCKDCGYNEGITMFLHGFGDDPWSTIGYQCQNCGIFTTIFTSHESELSSPPPCKCGGILSRNKKLFCPECRSLNVNYRWSFMT